MEAISSSNVGSEDSLNSGILPSVLKESIDIGEKKNELNSDVSPTMQKSSREMVSAASSTSKSSLSRRGRASPAPTARVPLILQSQERKARRCKFYRNGDRWFPGAILAVSAERHRTWGALLEDATRLLQHPLHLPAGVRFVFSLDGNKIDSLELLESAGEYVASSTDCFKQIDYGTASLPLWRLHVKRRESLHVPSPSSARRYKNGTSEFSTIETSTKAKIIVIFRNGQKPRKAVRFLMNKRTAKSFDQVMEDLSVSLQLDSGAVRKMYGINGKQVNSLKDFYEDDVFIAYGLERCCNSDFSLDAEETRLKLSLLKGSSCSSARKFVLPAKLRIISSHDNAGARRPYSPQGSDKASSNEGLSGSQYNISLSSEELFLPAAISSRYFVGRVLGDGNFAVVRECQELTGEQRKFALKIIDKSKCEGKEDMIQSEVSILRKVCHENIVRLLDEIDCADFLYLVMELVTGGDLFDAIAAATRYTEREASRLVRDLASALEYLHQRNIVHRDVKPENLLVVPGEMPRLKLGDFGLAVELTGPLFTICGTPTYVAPEILAESGYGLEVDIWAAGVIAYILLCGFPPFISATNDQEELFEQILGGELHYPSPYWDHVGIAPRHLIACMIVVDSHQRFTAAQVLEHPWITGEITEETMHVHPESVEQMRSRDGPLLVYPSEQVLYNYGQALQAEQDVYHLGADYSYNGDPVSEDEFSLQHVENAEDYHSRAAFENNGNEGLVADSGSMSNGNSRLHLTS